MSLATDISESAIKQLSKLDLQLDEKTRRKYSKMGLLVVEFRLF